MSRTKLVLGLTVLTGLLVLLVYYFWMFILPGMILGFVLRGQKPLLVSAIGAVATVVTWKLVAGELPFREIFAAPSTIPGDQYLWMILPALVNVLAAWFFVWLGYRIPPGFVEGFRQGASG